MARHVRVALFCVCAMLIAVASLPVRPVFAAGATLQLTKQAVTPVVNTGDVAVYALDYKCASTTQDCRNVVVTDVLPAQLSAAPSHVELIGTVHTASQSYDPATHTATWTFKDPLPAGSTGTLELRVRFPAGSTPNGTVASNRAEIRADNAPPVLSNIAQITARAQTRAYAEKTLISGGALGVPSTYRVQVCVPAGSSSGGLNLDNILIVDDLPAGAIFESASHGGSYDAGTHRVSWPAAELQVSGGGACVSRTVTVRFTADNFAVGEQVRNDMSATAVPVGGGSISLSASDIRLIQPPTPGMSFSKAGPQRALVGQTISYSFNLQNTGTTPLSEVTIVDPIPAELRVSRIYAGEHNLLPTALPLIIEYRSNLNPTYTAVPGSPFSADACVNVAPTSGGGCATSLSLAGGEFITELRYRYAVDLPFGFSSLSPQQRSGFEAEVVSTPVNAIIVNNASGTFNLNGVPATRESTTNTRVAPVAARPIVRKTVTPAVAYLGDEVTYSLVLRNEALGGGTPALADPMLADLLDPALAYVPGSWSVAEKPAGAPDPVFELIPNYNGGGRELLRWRWEGSAAYSLPAGQQIRVVFRARISPYAPTGVLGNTGYLAGSATPADQIALENCEQSLADSHDLDGDGNTSELLCSSRVQNVSLSSAATMDSAKLVIGQLDASYNRYPDSGLTTPGGRADYQLLITNTGSIPVTELTIVDVLPWVGDSGVVDFSPRESEWRPYLIGPIEAPAGAVVFYSTQQNPCRAPDLGISPDSPGCTPPDWSTVFPADPTTVQALKIEFGDRVILPNNSVTLGWPMRAPVGGTSGEIAWNSFGFRAKRADTGEFLLASEPIKVGIERGPIIPPAYGNYVWRDDDLDGLQDADEPGVNGARIELYDTGPDGVPASGDETLIAYTLSGPDDAGNPGYYLFSDPVVMLPGDYYIVVTPPAGYGFTIANQGPDDQDSDIDPATGRSAVTTLDPGEIDLSWDVGLITTTAVGNYVWHDRDGDGEQDEPASDGLNGVTVRLYTSTGVLVDTTVTGPDLAGRPGYYLFDGLDAGDYYIEFVLPAGASFSPRDIGADTTDSDADPVTGRSEIFSLADKELDLTRDAGVIFPAGNLRLGDRVWYDRDNDGRREPGDGEVGIDGVRLNLYRDLDGDNIADPGEFIASTTSETIDGQAGFYEFTDLAPGDYIVEVAAENFAPGGPLAGLVSSAGNDPAPDPDDDIDNDDNGSHSGASVFSRAVTLSAGAEPTDDGDGNNGNLSVDFGFAPPGALGDRVWYDLDGDGLQDAGELGVPGVTVELLDGAGNPIDGDPATPGVQPMIAVTDSFGVYGFSGLPAGNYRLRFSDLPAGVSISPRDAGADDELDSDVDPVTATTDVITLPGPISDLSWDLGLTTTPASLGDRIWIDDNRDGIQDAGETSNPGGVLDGISVQLWRADGTLWATTTTSGGGFYSFNGLPPGQYYVQFGPAPAGYAISPQNQGADDTADSDADQITRRTAIATLAPGQNDPSWDLGLFTFAELGDRVWNDVDNDGVQDPGESGVSGVSVRLFRPGDGTPVATTVTDTNGNYRFSNLIPGDYYLEFGLPSGYAPSPRNTAGAGAANDSDPDPDTRQTDIITLAPGDSDMTWDFGIYRTARIGDRVWLDIDADGVQDANETTGVSGVQVVLLDSAGTVINTTVTDASGNYAFTDLPPGDYWLRFIPPPSYVASPQDKGGNDSRDSDPDPTTLETELTTLVAGENDSTWDLGLYQLSSLGDLIWHDQNANGQQDAGEPGVDGVEVTLFSAGDNGIVGDGDDTIVDTTISAGGGRYLFEDLVPGRYYIQFGPTPGFSDVSPANSTGATDTTDSDVDPVTRRTPAIDLGSSQADMSWDMGLFNRASLGNLIWRDDDADGVQDPEETFGFDGVTVELYHADGTLAGVTVSAGGGLYSFDDLLPGDYYLVFSDLPTGYAITRVQQGGDDTRDSDADPISRRTGFISLPSGANDTRWDVGLFQTSSVGDRVWIDLDADGVQDPGEDVGVPGVRVELLDGATVVDTTYTDTDGLYRFTDLLPGDYSLRFSNIPAGWLRSPQDQGSDDSADSDADASFETATFTLPMATEDLSYDLGLYQLAAVGDLVWFDADGDGLQDVGEPGVSGVVVELYDAAGAVLLDSTITDGSGLYLFDGLAPGSYRLRFVAPAGTALTVPNAPGGADRDSDADPISGMTGTITLTSGQIDLDRDAGIYQPLRLGNQVWEDLDNDGLYEPADGEPGISGVEISLYRDSDNSGDYSAGDELVASTTTGADGSYLFTDLAPGSYVVLIDQTNFDSGPLVGYTSSTGARSFALGPYEPAPSPENDVDGDDNGTAAPSGVSSRAIVLVSRDEPDTPVDGDDTDGNLSLDFGFFCGASLGNFVWHDLNGDGVQDVDEPGLEDVTVTLYRADNDVELATTTTDSTGLYRFDDLVPGDYYVIFSDLPTGYYFTRQNAGGDDTLDSDADRSSGRTADVTLVSGQDDPTWDAGVTTLVGLGDFVWEDLDGDGVQDAGEPGVSGVTVTLYRADDDSLVDTQLSNASGFYQFLDLPPGSYYLVFSGLPAGYEFTAADQGGDNTLDSDPDPTSGRTDTINLISTRNDPTWDAGLIRRAAVGDLVWEDVNGDGVQDASEFGVPGVTVTLMRPGADGLPGTADDVVIGTQITDMDGLYRFDNLLPGEYFVAFSDIPAGYTFTRNDRGGDDELDSDADRSSGSSAVFTLLSGTTDLSRDVGLYQPASLGDRVWSDRDMDGIQGAGEVGVPGVVVQLLQGGTVISETTTLADGSYLFTDLPAGDYTVLVQVPAGWRTSPQDAGSDDSVDSDIDPLTGTSGLVTLHPGDAVETVDAGIFQLASVGNTVWHDKDADGIHDPDEEGVAGVTVRLYHADGTLAGIAVTGADGTFIFKDVVPGQYYISFEPPAGYVISPANQGNDDGRDSDADPTDGRTAIFTLNAGDVDLSWWLGLSRPPTAITLLDLRAEQVAGGVRLRWETGVELNTAGFHLYRSADGLRANAEPVTQERIVARGSISAGASYSFLDTGAAPGVSYTYWLQEIETGGGRNEYRFELGRPAPQQAYTLMLPLLQR